MTRLQVLAVVVGVALALAALRVYVTSSQEFELARQSQATLHMDSAIDHYRRSARMYLPLNPNNAQALHELLLIGARAEQAGKLSQALRAYRSIRAAIMSTRHVWIPHEAVYHKNNQNIARVMAKEEPTLIDARKSQTERQREYLAQLEQEIRPYTSWSLIGVFGFGVWVFGAYRLFDRGFDEQNRWLPRVAWPSLGWMMIGLAMFVSGMLFA